MDQDLHAARLVGIAANPATPADVLLRLLAHAPARDAHRVICRERDLPAEVVDAIVAHRDGRLRGHFVRNRHVAVEQRVRLVDDPDWLVRTHLAAGPGREPAPEPLPDRTIVHMLATYDGDGLSELSFSGQITHAFRRTALTHPDPAVRRWACGSWFILNDDQRARLLADPEDAVREQAAWWNRYFDPEVMERELPEQECHARTHILVNCALSPAVVRNALDRGESYALAGNPFAPPEVVARLARAERPDVRALVAARGDLPDELVAELAVDPDITVRSAVALRHGLTEEQRAAIDYAVDPDPWIGPIPQPFHARTPEHLTALARSAHPGLRRTAAADPGLPAALVPLLARDEDRAVRLLLAHNHPDAPAELLLAAYLEDTGDRRHLLPARPGFPRTGFFRLADHADPQVRRLAATDPDMPAETALRLSRDPDPEVRAAAAAAPRLPRARLRALLDDPATARQAAANPRLPAALLHAFLDEAGVPAR